MPRGDELQPVARATGGRSDHRAQAPLPDSNAIKQTCRPASGLNRRLGDLKRAHRNRCVDGSDAANPRPSAAPNPNLRGTRDSETAHKEFEGTPRDNPVAPTPLVRG